MISVCYNFFEKQGRTPVNGYKNLKTRALFLYCLFLQAMSKMDKNKLSRNDFAEPRAILDKGLA
jgi:uncharacterized membrane protein